MKIPQLKKKPELKSCHNITWEDDYSWIHQENIYLPAYAIITANNIEEIIINVLTNFDIFFVEVLANQLSKI